MNQGLYFYTIVVVLFIISILNILSYIFSNKIKIKHSLLLVSILNISIIIILLLTWHSIIDYTETNNLPGNRFSSAIFNIMLFSTYVINNISLVISVTISLLKK